MLWLDSNLLIWYCSSTDEYARRFCRLHSSALNNLPSELAIMATKALGLYDCNLECITHCGVVIHQRSGMAGLRRDNAEVY